MWQKMQKLPLNRATAGPWLFPVLLVPALALALAGPVDSPAPAAEGAAAPAVEATATPSAQGRAAVPTVTCVPPDDGWHADNVAVRCTATGDLADPGDASFA